ncbi:hypothetical protein CP533_0282 [Ophiocordyceps camponoti-saundersi (nom. inval.)]|nr:hypothetical protein CP533_0282 [Ophiocordyceps camponoti-saundersi (nom. inval.)]
MHLGRALACFLLPWLGTAKSLEARSPPKFVSGSPDGDPRLMYIVGPIPAASAFSLGIFGSYGLEHRCVLWGSYEMVAVMPGRYHVVAHTNPQAAIQGWARSWTRRHGRSRPPFFNSIQIYAVSLTEDDRLLARFDNDSVLYSTYWSTCDARAWPPRFVHYYATIPSVTDYSFLADDDIAREAIHRLRWRARRHATLSPLVGLAPIRSAPVGSTTCQCQTNYHLTQQLNGLLSLGSDLLNVLYPEAVQFLRDIFCDHLAGEAEYNRCAEISDEVARARLGIEQGPSRPDAPVPVVGQAEPPPMADQPMDPNPNPVSPIPEAKLPPGQARSPMIRPAVRVPPPLALPEMPQGSFPAPKKPNPYITPAFHIARPVQIPTTPFISGLGPIPGPSHHPPRTHPYPLVVPSPVTQPGVAQPPPELPPSFEVPNPPPELSLSAPGPSQRRLEDELQEFACQTSFFSEEIFQGVWDALRPYVGMGIDRLQEHFPDLDETSLSLLSQGSCSPFHNHQLGKRSPETGDEGTKAANGTACENLAFSIAGKASNFSPEMEAQVLAPSFDGLEKIENCVELDSLQVRIELSSDVVYGWEGAGTNDDIFIKVGGQTILLLNSPWKGSVADQPVDLVKAFGNDAIDFKNFTQFSLFPRRSETMPPGGDPFKLKGSVRPPPYLFSTVKDILTGLIGLIFTARCVGDPHREVIVDKYSAVNQDIYRMRWPSKYDGQIALKDWHYSPFDTKAQTLAVSPPGILDFCSHLKALEVKLTLDGLWQSWFSGGTSDNVYLSIGMENKPGRGSILLAQSPSAGQEFTADFDLYKFFGQKTVPVSAILSYVDVYATPGSGQSANYTDGWQIKSIVFDGQCSDRNHTVRANINFPDGKWVERQAGKEWGLVYTHDKMGLERWFRVD